LSSDTGKNKFYHNNGDGTFTYQHNLITATEDSFYYQVVSSLGDTSYPAKVRLFLIPPPTLTIQSPAEDDTLNWSTADVNFSSLGDLDEAALVGITLDGGSIVWSESLNGSVLYEQLTPGNHTLIASLYNADSLLLPEPESRDTIHFVAAPAPFSVIGDASANGSGCYMITDNKNYEAGSIWYEVPLNLLHGFDFSFSINLGDKDANGADGMTFVLQHAADSTDALGGAGIGLGAGGLLPSLGIEFDTYFNNNSGDLTSDHLAFFQNGDLTDPVKTPVCILESCENAEDGLDHAVQIVWDPKQPLFAIYIDGILRDSLQRDIYSTYFPDMPFVTMGFTGSTGGLNNEQTVCLTDFREDVLPSVEITNLTADTLLFGTRVDIAFTATNASGYNGQVGVSLDGQAPVLTGLLSGSITLDSVAEGTHTVSIQLIDAQGQGMTYVGAADTVDFLLDALIFVAVGDAEQEGEQCYQLTDEKNYEAGAIWMDDQVDLRRSFELVCDINLGDKDNNGADGMTFLLHRDSAGLAALGVPGVSMAAGGLTPSFGVDFDTYFNNGKGDINEDHLSFFANGDPTNPLQSPVCLISECGDIEDGQWRRLRIVWNPISATMEVDLDGVEIDTYTGDIVNGFLGGEPLVYLGFTASTGGLHNAHRVCPVSFEQESFPGLQFTSPFMDERVQADSIMAQYLFEGNPGLATGVLIQLDQRPATFLTDLSGSYIFNGLASGPHDITVTAAADANTPLDYPGSSDTVRFYALPVQFSTVGDAEGLGGLCYRLTEDKNY
ncbi:MAG: L-type lectin-domain containing protein, partial [Bacteroidota bacterium]